MKAKYVPAPRLVGMQLNPDPGCWPIGSLRQGQHLDGVRKGMILGLRVAGRSKTKTAVILGIWRRYISEDMIRASIRSMPWRSHVYIEVRAERS